MPDFNPIQTNATAGEISPKMLGRVDIARYNNAYQTLKNYVIMPQGGVYRRSGTKFVNQIKDMSAKGRLLEFEFSTTQAYIILAENQIFRFFKDEAIITATAQNITGITAANPPVVTYTGADTYANGDRIVITGVVGMVEVNNREFAVANVNAGANTFELSGINATTYTAYSSGGTVAEIYEIASPYLTADLFGIQYTQSADVMYLVHSTYAPRKLSRTGHASWTLTTIDFQDGPYLPQNSSVTNLQIDNAAVGAGRIVTADSVTGINGGLGFLTTDVGRLIRMKVGGASWGWMKITARTDTTHVTVTVVTTVTTATTNTLVWRLGAWSDTTGYPTTVCFHEERLTFANSTNNPQTVWMSNSADYENFSPTAADGSVGDSYAITYTIASNKVNAIRWLDSGTVELLGTAGGEWQAKPASTADPLTATNISVTPQTGYGSRPIRPRRVGSAVLFVQRSGRKIRELVYSFEVDGFVAKDLSLLAEHLFRQTTSDYIVDVAYQAEPDSIYWIVTNAGKLIGMTYLKEQDVVGFFQCPIAGGGSTDAVVESVAVIPTADGTEDQLWASVKRTVNGGTVRYVEFIENPFNPSDEDDKDDMYFVDCGLTYDSTATNTISGLFHLEGESVQVVGDGSVRNSATVTLGKITVTGAAASTVHVGKQFKSDIKTLPIEGGGAAGTAQGKVKRTHRVLVRMLNSLGLKYGKDFDNLTPLEFRQTDTPMDDSPPLFTGDKPMSLESSYQKFDTYCLRQDQPYPSTILALMPETHVYK